MIPRRALLAVLFALSVFTGSRVNQAAQPNILFIYTDDQAAWTTGYSGNKDAHTPNIDRIRREGMWLENSFVVTPVCSPSRASLMTSRYSSELGIDDWIPPASSQGLDCELPVWPNLLKSAGYRTGLVGKWHIGHTPRHHPTHYGYDYFMGILKGGTSTANPTLEKDGKEKKFKGLTVDILTEHALRFIGQQDKRPWVLSLHYRAPHAAFLPVSDEDWSHFDGRTPTIQKYPDLNQAKATKNMREYLASIASIDRNVGRLLKQLDDMRIADNTVVIFTSDHGYNISHHGLMYKGNAFWLLNKVPPQKWDLIPARRRPNMFDTSLRVPTVVRWPGVVKPGSTATHTVTNLDWFPTLCEIGEVKFSQQPILRGRRLVPVLNGETDSWNNDLYAEYNMKNGATTRMRVYRTPEWKLMRDFASPGRAELYHLANDPDETVNLIDSERDDVLQAIAELDLKMTVMRQKIGDSM